MSNLARGGVEVPVIETERLRLRGSRPEDFADSAAMWADPEVTRYIGGWPTLEVLFLARVGLPFASFLSPISFSFNHVQIFLDKNCTYLVT